MKTIVQLSDLHFGKTLFTTIEPLIFRVRELNPDLVIVSGDLTQRARVAQFEDARRFLDQLPKPQLVVPGNHDVPLYDVARRFLSPFARYRQFITSDFSPFFLDEEIAVAGINSARALVFKGGEIDTAQLDHIAEQFQRADNGQVRIVVAHHPFDVPSGLERIDPVKGAAEAVRRFSDLQVDVILAGHLHCIHEASTSRFVPDYEATILHAGTATSTRSRGEPNSFFVLRVGDDIRAETWKWNAERFTFDCTGSRSLPTRTKGSRSTPD